MNNEHKNEMAGAAARGFGLIEISIVTTVLGLTSAMAVPYFKQARENTRSASCSASRRVFENADDLYSLDSGRYASSINELYRSSYVKKPPSCPSGGNWSWDSNRKIFCSYHTGTPVPTGGPITLGALSAMLKGRWFVHGDSISTNWAGQVALFKVNLEEKGDYVIEMLAKNRAGHEGWTKVDGYNHFHVRVTVDGKRVPSLDIRVNDRAYQSDKTYINALKAGEHTVAIEWTNDAYKPHKRQDNNIEIKEIRISRKED